MKFLLLAFVGALLLGATGCIAVEHDHDRDHHPDHDRTVIIEHHDDDHPHPDEHP